MKEVRLFNYYNNGDDSKVNVYFADGAEWHRTITSTDVQKLAHEGKSYLPTLCEKYRQPQPKPRYVKGYIKKMYW